MTPPQSRSIRRLSQNGVYSVADYLLPQIGLLLAAPLLLKYLGIAQLGIWMLTAAATSSGVLVSSAFGDAAIKYASTWDKNDRRSTIEEVVRNTFAVNLCFGCLLGSLVWFCAPAISHHIAHLQPSLQPTCRACLRLGAILLVIRAVESLYVSTLRAVQQYAQAARITVSTRLAGLLASVLFASWNFGVTSVLTVSLIASAVSVCALCVAVWKATGLLIILPRTHADTLRRIGRFGSFTWLQALSALAFSQLDRILVGLILGPVAIAIYGICVQAAQPIHAITSAALHSLFPYLSSQTARATPYELRRTIRGALVANCCISLVLSLTTVLFAHRILSVWIGPAFADRAASLLSILAVGFGLLSLNVTAHYSLLALGKAREVALLNLLGAAAALSLIAPLSRHFNLPGTACARLIYGPVTWALYLVLHRALRPHQLADFALAPHAILENQ